MTKFDPERAEWPRSRRLLPALQKTLEEAVNAQGLLREAALYHLGRPGKRLRARLALATAGAFGIPARQMLPVAAGVELLHEASLIHDDLQDRDEERRGAPTVWHRYGEDTALLLGDTFLGHALGLLAKGPAPLAGELVSLGSKAVQQLAQGQLMDLRLTSGSIQDIDRYETLVRLKTGALLSLPVSCAALVGGESAQSAASLGDAIGWLGVTYQVLDDLADLDGTKDRAAGSDYREQRPSAVWLHAGRLNVHPFQNAHGRELVREACLAHAASALDKWRRVSAGLPEPPRRVLETAGRELALGPCPSSSPMPPLMDNWSIGVLAS